MKKLFVTISTDIYTLIRQWPQLFNAAIKNIRAVMFHDKIARSSEFPYALRSKVSVWIGDIRRE